MKYQWFTFFKHKEKILTYSLFLKKSTILFAKLHLDQEISITWSAICF